VYPGQRVRRSRLSKIMRSIYPH